VVGGAFTRARSGDIARARASARQRRRSTIKIVATLAVLGTLGSLAGCSDSARKQPTLDEDLAAIAAFNARYLGAINAGDIKTLSSLTTDGHVMIAPNRPPIVGKAANDAMNGRAFEQFEFDESWSPVETVISGDLAVQRGTYVTSAKPRAGGEARTVKGNFLRIYQRQPNGEWRMTRDTFNSEPPPGGAGAPSTNGSSSAPSN
jgi:ketosteroid isomerase-like protein